MPPDLRHLTAAIAAVLLPLLLLPPVAASNHQQFREAPAFRNGVSCPPPHENSTTMHIAMTLDYATPYLRGSIAAVLSVLQHSSCPENTAFHFLATPDHRYNLLRTMTSTFPYLRFHLYPFNPATVNHLISSSIRRALDEPLNYHYKKKMFLEAVF